ncbi:MAG: DEAD/DEAH box helicase [Bdellovibrionales bacterium]|nr:DEAD/DEAH box helicase [Bdellovibrionales bacterium]
MKSFNELDLSAPIQRAITELGFETPSPIQQQALPILLGDDTDFIGLAATGTGKTAAFSIPMLEKINSDLKAVQCLILCPTRELALQVAGQIDLLGKYNKVKALPIYGGARYDDQIFGLKTGAKVVVGTPGRVIDHINRGTLKLDKLTTLILDEADEMISMGFKEDLEKILEAAPREKSKIWLFSATMSKEIRKVADTYLEDPKQVQVNRVEMLSANVEQLYYITRESDKPEVLCKLIEAAEDFYGVIFCQTKSLVTDLSHFLTSRGYKVDSLHGDKDQNARERTMLAFRNRKVTILVCTDVAARGLDVKDVTHVINYSIPRELDSYVHRIGRTARSGKSGFAMSLVTPATRSLIGRIEQMTKSKMKEGKVPTRKDIGAKKVSKILSKFQDQKFYERAMEHVGNEWQIALAGMTIEEVVGRFLALSSPDIFEDRETGKATMVNTSGVAKEGGGGRRREGGGRGRDGGRRGDRRGSRRDRAAGEGRSFRAEGRSGGRDTEGGRDGRRTKSGDKKRFRSKGGSMRKFSRSGPKENRAST